MLTERMQQALRAAGLDGWLFFDHHRRDPLANRILRLPEEFRLFPYAPIFSDGRISSA
jgi:hypothetical protein